MTLVLNMEDKEAPVMEQDSWAMDLHLNNGQPVAKMTSLHYTTLL